MRSKNPTRAAFISTRSTAWAVAGAIILTVSGVAQAKADDADARDCNNATLSGLYAFHASGFNIVGGAAQPKAIVELIQFNGDGTLTGGPPKSSLSATVSINGNIFLTSPTPARPRRPPCAHPGL